MKRVIVKGKYLTVSAVFLLSLIFASFVHDPVSAAPDPYLAGGSPITTVRDVASALTDIYVAGTGNPTVPVKLRVVYGTLAMGTTTGLTFTGSSTGSTLQFSGTLSNVNAALATLTYTRNGLGTDTLEASLVNAGEVFFADTGHLYEYVSYTASWNNAKSNAESRTKYGAAGYLTTVTSQAENDFVAERLTNAGWMGASDSAIEGDWKWVVGPEVGTSFWSGASGGSTVSSRYANWGTGEPNNASEEDCAQFLTGGSGKWNDLPCAVTTLPGYVVEYGSPSSPIDISSVNVSITTIAANTAPNTPTSLSGYLDGAGTTVNTPSLVFSLTDNNVTDTLRYRVQIDDTADFSSPVIDYTSGLAVQGSRTFMVGQSAGSGTYTSGFSGQSLNDGSYYWRVRSIDGGAATSSYAVANSGAIAFKVDTTAPTIPGSLSTTDVSTDSTPSVSWLASSDATIGLHGSSPYSIQWAQNALFTGAQSSNSTINTFTVPSSLADGMWYLRVRSRDALSNYSTYSQTLIFVVDTTGPSQPGTPQSTTNSSLPTWTWGASADAGTGGVSYVLEWANTADFSGTLNMMAVSTNSYAHTTALADGTWYFRVKAFDSVNNTSTYSVVGSVVILTPKPATPTQSVPTPVARTTQGTPTIPPETVEATPISGAGSVILLDVFDTYSDGTGKQLELQPQQKVFFTHKEEDHSATVKEVKSDFVVVTVASTPTDRRVEKGNSVDHDVDGDGAADIRIAYNGMKGTLADIVFTKLVTSPTIAVNAKQVSNRSPWLLVFLVVMILTYWYIHRRKHNKENT